MFFKNIRVYQLTEKLNLNKLAFETALAEHKFTPCMGQDALKLGFAFAVHPSVKELVTELGDGLFMVALKRQEKVLPAAVINEELQPKIDALEAEKGRPLSRKEKQALKEELIQTLLPRAFSRSTLTRALIDDTNGLVFVDTASPSRAEDLLALLRKSIGSLPAVPWIDSNMLSQSLQSWVAGQNLPAGYVLGHAARFKAPDEEGARASFENHLLSAAEVQSHLEDKLVTELDLVKPEQLEFRITECGGIKRLRWEELLINQNDELGWEDLVVRLEADALLMRSELVGMVSAIRAVVGPVQVEVMSCTFDRFTKDTSEHQLKIQRDDGLFRHLTVQKPSTGSMHYHITTWPGYLCISGDMGCFVFSRLPDMFQFFRGNPGEINPHYWQEKLQAGAGYDGARAVSEEFDGAAYDQRMDQYLANFVEDLDPSDADEAEQIEAATQAVKDFKAWREDSEWDVVSRINNWDPSAAGGLELDDFFEGRLDKLKFHYIWCCYAIVHAIAMYDEAKASEVAA